MRKIIALLIFINVIFISASASAFGFRNADMKPVGFIAKLNQESKTGGLQKQNQQIKQQIAQIKSLEQQMEQNKKKLNQLKTQSLKACNVAKNRISKLLNKKNKLTKDQIDALADAVKLLKQYNDELNSLNNEINNEAQNLIDAKNANNYDLIIQTLNNIISSQNDRINHFQTIIDGVNEIAVM